MHARSELIFALCHELANLLAGVRLEANLQGGRPEGGELEQSSARISQASARAGSLLALVRPLLEPASLARLATDPLDMLDGLRTGLDDSIDARVVIALKSAVEVPSAMLSPDIVHHLLLTAVFAGLEADRSGGRVRVSCRSHGERVEFVVEDGGGAFEFEPSDALRGRTLTLAVSRVILDEMGGGLRIERPADRTETVFELPAEPA